MVHLREYASLVQILSQPKRISHALQIILFVLKVNPASLWKSNLSPGVSDKLFDALNLKVANIPQIACQCAVTFDEISLKSALVYNSHRDVIEGFENFGDLDQSKYMATN